MVIDILALSKKDFKPMIKHLTLALLTGLLTLTSFGQERKDLTLSFSAGKLSSPYYDHNTSGRFASFDFDYSLSKRHTLSVNYTDGKHRYYDNGRITGPVSDIYSDGTNSEATYHTFSVLYKYRFISSTHLSGSIGAGAGMMTHSRMYPFSTGNGYSYQESAWTDLVFPVRLEADYHLSKNLKAGLIGGFFIQPDYPVLAYHIGPRFSYIIK
jgi:hypothetical protein